MKLITWNCNGAFRRKFQELSQFDADIIVIQECEDPNSTTDSKFNGWASNYLWQGDNKNRGIGIFCKNAIKLERLNWSNVYEGHEVKHFLPVRINDDIDIINIWTSRNKSPNFGYIGQLWKYLKINGKKLNKSILIGDLNSNAIWDQWDRWWNHTDVVNELEKQKIHSLYHKTTKETQGFESTPTFYLHRNLQKPYHIDYIFAHESTFNSIRYLDIGKPEIFLKYSDHMPIFCELN